MEETNCVGSAAEDNHSSAIRKTASGDSLNIRINLKESSIATNSDAQQMQPADMRNKFIEMSDKQRIFSSKNNNSLNSCGSDVKHMRSIHDERNTNDVDLQEYKVASYQRYTDPSKYCTKSTWHLMNALPKYFNGRKFNFTKFARVNGIAIDKKCVPHSEIVKDSFLKMYNVVQSLCGDGIIFEKDGCFSSVGLTRDDINIAFNVIDNPRLSDEDKAYKLYGELGKIILNKLLIVAKDESFAKNVKSAKRRLEHASNQYKNLLEVINSGCSIDNSCTQLTNYDLCKTILSLPLINIPGAFEICAQLLQTTSLQTDDEANLTQSGSDKHQYFVDEFKKLGMFFDGNDLELAKEILLSAKLAISAGMPMPLFVCQSSNESSKAFRTSLGGIGGIVVSNDQPSRELSFGRGHNVLQYKQSHKVFYRKIIRHVRRTVGVMHIDKSVSRKHLSEVLEGHNDVIGAIRSQFGKAALFNSENYIECFGSIVLCCLEQNKNPFDYISDKRLWRLYYEFGGPDFAPIIHKKGFSTFGYDKNCNILSDSKCNWCSGYPSKFGINLNEKRNGQNIKVELLSEKVIGQPQYSVVNDRVILPPPPLGCQYIIKYNKLRFKTTDGGLYKPTFCRLTDGSLTLKKTKPLLRHHFESLLETKEIETKRTFLDAIKNWLATIRLNKVAVVAICVLLVLSAAFIAPLLWVVI